MCRSRSSFIVILLKILASLTLAHFQLQTANAQPARDIAAPPATGPSVVLDATETPPATALIQWNVRPTIVVTGQPAAPRSITSIGTCSLLIDVDRARVTILAVGASATPQQAVERARTAAEAIQAAIGTLGLADLEVRASLSRTDTNVTDRNPSFTASIALEFATSSIDRMGEIVTAVAVLGQGTVAEFVRYVSDDRRRAAEGDCLAIASGNARARAERLASALGATLGPVLTVHDGTPPAPDPGLRTSKLAGEEALPLAATLDRLPVMLSIVVEFALE